MKRIFSMFFLITLAIISFVSCGSDEEENGINKVTSEMDNELKPYIGYWETDDDNGYNLLLFSDGICYAEHKWDGSKYLTGKWSYDATTKYLTNSATKTSMMVTMVDETTLMGIDVSGKKNVSYTKGTVSGWLMLFGKWVDENKKTLEIPYGNKGDLRGSAAPELPEDTKYYGWSSQWLQSGVVNNDPLTIDYQIIYRTWHAQLGSNDYRESNKKGKIVFENPYSFYKSKIKVSGAIEGTFHRVTP